MNEVYMWQCRKGFVCFCLRRTLVLVLWITFLHTAMLQTKTLAMQEVWVAIRHDGRPGSGTVGDAFDGGTVEKLNALFDKFRREYGDNLTLNFGPGVYEGDQLWEPGNNWKIKGSGMDITIFRTKSNPEAIATVGFKAGNYTGGPSGFEISDVTFDFNVLNLRRPNRAFIYPLRIGYEVSYLRVNAVPEWTPETSYSRGKVARFQDTEFIALEKSRGKVPAQGRFWSILRPNRSDELPTWQAEKTYKLGEAVAKGSQAYLCITTNQCRKTVQDNSCWKAIDPIAADPDIYTTAVFVCTCPPGGDTEPLGLR